MRPRWQAIEKELPWLKTEYYDFDQDKTAIERNKVESGTLPVFIFLDKTGQEIRRLNGEVEKDKLMAVINEHRDK
ncbi:hypothetical protein A2W24_03570 [Microgenomates group bacterium RBG_16_45_19]|nr:MAG: hypothetical protein A2W24_03570 [Microgenomates group bacterium RBG_16_45_19]